MIQERQSRFIVAHANGRRDQNQVEEAITKVHARCGGQPVAWYSDGWQAYTEALSGAPTAETREDGPGWASAPASARGALPHPDDQAP